MPCAGAGVQTQKGIAYEQLFLPTVRRQLHLDPYSGRHHHLLLLQQLTPTYGGGVVTFGRSRKKTAKVPDLSAA